MTTGHLGFIGSHLHEALGGTGIDIKEGNDILLYDFSEDTEKTIFHLAAQASIPKSFEDPIGSHTENVVGTLMVLEHAKNIGAKVIFSSSSSVYDPVSPYALQKKMCEDYMKFYWTLGVKSVALRYFNVFGERQEIANGGNALLLARFLDQKAKDEPFTIYGTGEQRRDFVYVKDVAQANFDAALAFSRGMSFESFNIGGGFDYSINEITDMIDKDHPKVYLLPRFEPRITSCNNFRAQSMLNWFPETKLQEWIQSQF